jgi:KDO2-lipid IV(A) lauroyltransferase
VVRRQRNPLFDRAINASRSRFGIRVIDRSQATRAVMAGLRANHVIALIADQDARGAGIFVPFFGRQASSPRGPAVMALRTGAPLVLMVPLRMPDGRLEVRFRRIEVDRSGDPEAAARRITAAFANGLEAGVREAPEQYLWQHRRWKTRPPQEQRRRDPV